LKAQQFRETLVPLFNCPSDFAPELAVPHSGPASTANVNFRTGSYRANAGRGEGNVTWYLLEAIPSNTASGPGLNKGWRGPVHAECTEVANWPVGTYNINHRENIKAISDGTSKTLLLGESTNQFNRRRTFWAYTWGNAIMSQPTPYAPTLLGDWCRCVPPGADPCPSTSGGPPAYGTSNRACMSGWFSNHPSGMNAVFCDGSVTFYSFDVDLNVFAAIGSIANGENDLTGI
jgi:prepilin-type processing-associated H-X9-DG protein